MLTVSERRYTPSTEEVRAQYWSAPNASSEGSLLWGEPDRWLEQVRREAKAEALEEAREAVGERVDPVADADPLTCLINGGLRLALAAIDALVETKGEDDE